MKQFYLLLSAILVSVMVNAQTISTLENLTLTPGTYWDGSDNSGGYASGNAYFPNSYDTAWFYWSGGWAYSSVNDSTTSGFMNMFGAKAYTGYSGSSNYGVGTQGARVRLTGAALGGLVNGVYVTNGTYAYNSMRDGDGFGKKFGGVSGNDPDFFKLTIRNYYGGVMTNDSVEFYLADFRFVNNTQDYEVNSWTWVDLTSLGNTDSLEFILTSSDNGVNGMNTPAYFCIDNLETADSPLSVTTISESKSIVAYPNPAHDVLNIRTAGVNSELRLLDMNGRIVKSLNSNAATTQVLMSDVPAGMYLLEVQNEQGVQRLRVSKN